MTDSSGTDKDDLEHEEDTHHWALGARLPGGLRDTGAGVGEGWTLQLVSLMEEKKHQMEDQLKEPLIELSLKEQPAGMFVGVKHVAMATLQGGAIEAEREEAEAVRCISYIVNAFWVIHSL